MAAGELLQFRMLTFLTKKKLREDKAANIFVNSLLRLVEDGFPEVAALINDSPEFKQPPNISPEDSDRFLLIIIAGNMKLLPKYFDNFQGLRLRDMALRKFSYALGLKNEILQTSVSKLQVYFKKVNHPSRNTLYAMSKAIFFKYELVNYQEDYFVKMESPNPVFLKRLNETVANFVWDWEELKEQYRITE